ncbi:VOC family protein [Parasphingopyxis lamellibrachiae]|uniref:Catechol 2,3-dioxygenase-like lactoylglutathione lyase family enzyme n=1 Tax=Parasphingopyxis lamellibrachiae TaxID=680125 RepID=A0A3D9FIL0_9SPHN|nr:VOC family protein [Parasphingopyxis lamellibrachiae]RED17629.1 catechol 2,3-dioxygenase-like lactoylglutathione lyase family enzyme [Parasphingopyxis lamellibrachiae]
MAFSLKTKITTPRLAETRDYYVRVFDMVVAEEWDSPNDKGVILAFRNGREEAFLEIYDGEEAHDFSGLSLQFRTGNLTAFVERLDPGMERRGPVERPWGSHYLYLTDPNGVAIIVYQGGL